MRKSRILALKYFQKTIKKIIFSGKFTNGLKMPGKSKNHISVDFHRFRALFRSLVEKAKMANFTATPGQNAVF